MPAFRLALPFALLFALGLYLSFQHDPNWSILVIINMVILVAAYILAPQINWAWWKRFPPDLPKEMHGFLFNYIPFYQQLKEEQQREFRRRVFLFNEGNSFMPQAIEEMPLDGKVMIAAAPISLTFFYPDFLFSSFENIVIYPHSFPSPQYPEHFHASEIYEPDGVTMFCLEHVARGTIEAQQYFNPAWYEYTKVFRLAYPQLNYGDWSVVEWETLEAISTFPHEALKEWIGLNTLDKIAMGISFFFLFPNRFQQTLPHLYQQLQLVFRQKNI